MKKGFTLIELLVVVLIIGILSSVALPQYQVAVAKARTAEYLVGLKAIEQGQNLFFMNNDTYTNDLSLLDIEVDINKYYCILDATNNVYCQTYWKESSPALELRLVSGIGTVNCLANTDLKKKTCKSLGGTNEFLHSNGTTYYVLHK